MCAAAISQSLCSSCGGSGREGAGELGGSEGLRIDQAEPIQGVAWNAALQDFGICCGAQRFLRPRQVEVREVSLALKCTEENSGARHYERRYLARTPAGHGCPD